MEFVLQQHRRHARSAGRAAPLVRADRDRLRRAGRGRGGHGAGPDGGLRGGPGRRTPWWPRARPRPRRSGRCARTSRRPRSPRAPTWKHDVSVPVSAGRRLHRARPTRPCGRFAPGARVVAFGHVGDGNIHYDVLRPDGGDGAAHAARRDEGSRIVHDIVRDARRLDLGRARPGRDEDGRGAALQVARSRSRPCAPSATRSTRSGS